MLIGTFWIRKLFSLTSIIYHLGVQFDRFESFEPLNRKTCVQKRTSIELGSIAKNLDFKLPSRNWRHNYGEYRFGEDCKLDFKRERKIGSIKFFSNSS